MTPGSHGFHPGDRPFIRYGEVLPLLIAACPSFRGSEQAKQVYEPDGDFLAVGHFVAHLIRAARSERDPCLPAVFAVVERVLAEGDGEARSLARRASCTSSRAWTGTGVRA